MTLLVFLLVLSILVVVHELGHFIVAKLAGVKVEEFGIGFPPKIISIRYGETVYSVNLLLFGGFVRLYGENEEINPTRKSDPDTLQKFRAKSTKIQASVITAGVVMNFLLSVIAFSILYSIVGIPKLFGEVRVTKIEEVSPAQKAGIKAGDAIVAVDGQPIQTNYEFIEIIRASEDKEVKIALRDIQTGEQREVVAVPEKKDDEVRLGVGIQDAEQHFPPLWQRPFWGAFYGVQEAILWGKQTVIGLLNVFTSFFTQGKVPKDIAGPVGIFHITEEVSQQGMLAILHFLGVLSVNLAILNILPIPPLDGGRLLFIGIDGLFGTRAKSIRMKLENALIVVGIGFFVVLFVAITLQDIRRLSGQ